MSFSRLFFYAAACTLTGAGRAANLNSYSNTTHDGPLNATEFYKSTSEVLSMPLKRVDHQGFGTPSLARRYFGTDVLGVYGAAYFAELTIGTSKNPQIVNVLLDTGSFELWVNPDCAASDVTSYCQSFGHYDPELSSTSKNLNKNFTIQYGLGDASGVYHQDDVYISGARLPNQQFGVSNASHDVWFGILGLGHGEDHGIIQYASIVDSLAAQGYTNSKLFSLDLGGQPGPTSAITGEMVFGGVDTNKYAGYLAKVPTDPSDAHYVVNLTSLSIQPPGSGSSSGAASQRIETIRDSNFPLPVVVDSGTTLSLFPEPVVKAIAAEFPGAEPDGKGGYTVPCSLRNDTAGRVNFELSGENGAPVTISVSYADFIWYAGENCMLGAWHKADVGVWILGDTFLRGAYVTFDQSNNALYMANYVACGKDSHLVPVPAGPDEAAKIRGSCAAPPSAQRVPVPTTTTRPGDDPDCSCTDAKFSTAFTTTATIATTATVNLQASAVPASNPPAPEDECDGDEPPQQQVLTATETFTSTFVQHIVYTAGNREVTSRVTVVTTFCPGDILPPASPTLAPARPHTQDRIEHTIASPSPSPPTIVATVAEVTHVGPKTSAVVETVHINAVLSPSPSSSPSTTPVFFSFSPPSPSPPSSPISSPLPQPPSAVQPQQQSQQQQTPNPTPGFASTGWGFNTSAPTPIALSTGTNAGTGSGSYREAVAGVANVGGHASGIVTGVFAPTVPTQGPLTHGGAVSVPTSGAGALRIGAGAGVGLWSVMAVIMGMGMVVVGGI